MDSINNIQKSIEHIEKNLKEKLKANDLAKAAHFSEFYFQRLFRNMVGETVMGYVRKRRLTEAAKDLINCNEKITDIAIDYQFGSEEAFSRAFSKAFGVSPKEYRSRGIPAILQEKARLSGLSYEPRKAKGHMMRMAA